jgi:hypothetical protein
MSSDITTAEIDTRVRDVLAQDATPHDRAKAAAALIEEHVRTEEGLDWDVRLYVPVDWQHRVPDSVRTEPGVILIPEGMADKMRFIHRQPDVIDGEVISEEPNPIKEAFDAAFEGDEKRSHLKFAQWWQKGKP